MTILKQVSDRAELEQLVADFLMLTDRRRSSMGKTPQQARGNCHEATNMLVWYVAGRGYAAYGLQVRGPRHVPRHVIQFRYENVDHWLAWFPGVELGVDLTARQFWPRVNYPALCDEMDLSIQFDRTYWPPADVLEKLCGTTSKKSRVKKRASRPSSS